VEIASFGGAGDGLASRGAGRVPGAGRQLREDRIEVLDRCRLAANHQAVPSLAAPDTAAGPDVHVMDALLRELLRAPDVVDVIGIAAVDEDVARHEMREKAADRRVHGRCRDHQPDGSRRLQLRHEIHDRSGPDGRRSDQVLDGFRRPVENDTLMAACEKPPGHVGAHAAKSDHPELHCVLPAVRPSSSAACRSKMSTNWRCRRAISKGRT
jgi:hypothetical protein